MASASVPGTTKPITMLVNIDRSNVWLCPADSMVARINAIHRKAEYMTAADSTCYAKSARNYLIRESIYA